jgi:hypothetical protein
MSEPFGYFRAEPFGWTDCAETDEGAVALYEAPPAQEIVCSTGLCHFKAQRTWTGLTHDEYDAICDKHSAMSDFEFLADIEAKLREKNQ